MGTILEVSGLSVSFSPVPGVVLDGIAFSLERSSRTAVIGPSGCGKTTLLRALAGCLGASISGSVQWASEVARPVPILWQDIRLFPWMTVVQNVEYVLRLNGSQRRRREAAREFLEAVGMSWASDLWPSRLSRGQAQRVALARCLATGSEVVLLDEPFASLDAITRKKMRGFLLDLAVARSLAYVLVTHDAQEAIELTDRILVLTARPARIIADFARRDGSFGANIEERIWELLR